MRDHLLDCLKKKFVQFPTKESVNIGLHTFIGKMNCFASCLMPKIYVDMVQCDYCEQWYHAYSDSEPWNLPTAFNFQH